MGRFSRITLVVDGCFLVFMGVITVVGVFQGWSTGTGPMGQAMHGRPYVAGFAEAALFIGVIGLGLLGAGLFAASWMWHVFAVLAHATLMSIDIGFRVETAQLGIDTSTLTVLTVLHAVFILAHLFNLTRVRTAVPA
jgi:hypothetical protein